VSYHKNYLYISPARELKHYRPHTDDLIPFINIETFGVLSIRNHKFIESIRNFYYKYNIPESEIQIPLEF